MQHENKIHVVYNNDQDFMPKVNAAWDGMVTCR